MKTQTKQCTSAIRKGRLAKARQFADTAALIESDDSLLDAYVTNCVHAGIAAADVICCLAKDLSALLTMKTAAGYSDVPISTTKKRQAGRAMARLLQAATQEGIA